MMDIFSPTLFHLCPEQFIQLLDVLLDIMKKELKRVREIQYYLVQSTIPLSTRKVLKNYLDFMHFWSNHYDAA